MTDDYKRLVSQLDGVKSHLASLVAAEKYEEACDVRDTLSGLQLQKRLMEISAKPRVVYRVGDLVVHKRYGELSQVAFSVRKAMGSHEEYTSAVSPSPRCVVFPSAECSSIPELPLPAVLLS